MRSTPPSRNCLKAVGWHPEPFVTFSAFAITTSMPRLARNSGTSVRTACKPGLPTMSPMNRTFMPTPPCLPLLDGSLRKLDGSGFADDSHFDFAGVIHLLFDGTGD